MRIKENVSNEINNLIEQIKGKQSSDGAWKLLHVEANLSSTKSTQ